MLKFSSLNYRGKVAKELFQWLPSSTLNRDQQDECKTDKLRTGPPPLFLLQ